MNVSMKIKEALAFANIPCIIVEPTHGNQISKERKIGQNSTRSRPYISTAGYELHPYLREAVIWYHGGKLDEAHRYKPLFLAAEAEDAAWFDSGAHGSKVHMFTLRGPFLNLRVPGAIDDFIEEVRSLGIDLTYEGDLQGGGAFQCDEIEKHCGYDGSSVYDLFYIPKVLDHFSRKYSYVLINDELSQQKFEAAVSLRPDGRILLDD